MPKPSECTTLRLKDARHPGARADLFINPLQAVGGAYESPALECKIKDCEPIRQVSSSLSDKRETGTKSSKTGLFHPLTQHPHIRSDRTLA